MDVTLECERCPLAGVCVLRHVHAVLGALLPIVRVGGGGVRGELVLPLHCDGDVTTLQIPGEHQWM